MPHLSIIPAPAVADTRLTDAQVRVLCAIGTFTNKLGGNVWASVRTLAAQSNLSERSVQRALPTLIEAGYVRRDERPGRTNLYEIVLQGVTLESPGGDTGVGGGVTLESPKRLKRNDKINDQAQEVLRLIWEVYPPREEKPVYIAALKAISTVLSEGHDPSLLIAAAHGYAKHVVRERTEKKYIKSLVRFYADGAWQGYVTPTVHGRTREEWARSGQDVAEFDRLAGAV